MYPQQRAQYLILLARKAEIERMAIWGEASHDEIILPVEQKATEVRLSLLPTFLHLRTVWTGVTQQEDSIPQ